MTATKQPTNQPTTHPPTDRPTIQPTNHPTKGLTEGFPPQARRFHESARLTLRTQELNQQKLTYVVRPVVISIRTGNRYRKLIPNYKLRRLLLSPATRSSTGMAKEINVRRPALCASLRP
jgi:hypothetical protein